MSIGRVFDIINKRIRIVALEHRLSVITPDNGKIELSV